MIKFISMIDRYVKISLSIAFIFFLTILAFSVRPGVDDLGFLNLCGQKNLADLITYNYDQFNFRTSYLMFCFIALKLTNVLYVVKFVFPAFHVAMLLLLYWGIKRCIQLSSNIPIKSYELHYTSTMLYLAFYFGTLASIEIFGSAINCFNYLYPVIAALVSFIVIYSDKLNPLIKTVLLIPLVFLIIGGSENVILFILMVHAWWNFASRNQDHPFKKQHRVLFGTLAILSVCVLTAPGNFNRFNIEGSQPLSMNHVYDLIYEIQNTWWLFMKKYFVSLALIFLVTQQYFKTKRVMPKAQMVSLWLLGLNLLIWLGVALFVFNGQVPLRVAFAVNLCMMIWMFLLCCSAAVHFTLPAWMLQYAQILAAVLIVDYFMKHGCAVLNYAKAYDHRLEHAALPPEWNVAEALPSSDIVVNGDISNDSTAYMNRLYKQVYGINMVLHTTENEQ